MESGMTDSSSPAEIPARFQPLENVTLTNPMTGEATLRG
jgi:hypothetical protein